MIFATHTFFAQTTAAPAGSSPSLGMLMPVLLLVMFYFMLIRPQRRQQKEHASRLAALRTGDEVIAAGGIHGLITNVAERTVTLKIADGIKIKVEKASVVTVLTKTDEPEVIQTEVVSP